eukprot:gene32448-40047_t
MAEDDNTLENSNIPPTNMDATDDYEYCAEHVSPRSVHSPYEFITPLEMPNSLWCLGPLKTAFIDTSALIVDIDSVEVLRSANLDCSTSVYCEELYEHYDELESSMSVDPMYLDRHAQISMSLRSSMVNKMLNVSYLLSLSTPTLFLGVSILDRYLSTETRRMILKSELLCLGYAALMIASKYEEGGRFPGDEYVDEFFEKVRVDNTSHTLTNMVREESTILFAINWHVESPTIYTYLCRYSRAGELSMTACGVARCICERALQEYTMLRYLPSLVAASAVSMARAIEGSAAWTCTLEHYTRYSQDDLAPCVAELQGCFVAETVARATQYACNLFLECEMEPTFEHLLKIISDQTDHDDNNTITSSAAVQIAPPPAAPRQNTKDDLYESSLMAIFEFNLNFEVRSRPRKMSRSDSVTSNCLYQSPVATPLNNRDRSASQTSASGAITVVQQQQAEERQRLFSFETVGGGASPCPVQMMGEDSAHTSMESLGSWKSNHSFSLPSDVINTSNSSMSENVMFSSHTHCHSRAGSMDETNMSALTFSHATPRNNNTTSSSSSSSHRFVCSLTDEVPCVRQKQAIRDGVKNRFPLAVYSQLITCSYY